MPIRLRRAGAIGRLPESAAWLALWLGAALAVAVPAGAPAQTAPAVPLDSVVAVVNRQVILSSDIEDAIQLSVLDPSAHVALSWQHALEELISRALIQQQIRREDLPAIMPTAAEVSARLEEIRRQSPACVRANCPTAEGWREFLAAHNLTQDRVETYLRNRMEILRFIEERFRQGIQITPEQIDAYYRDTLTPQYPPGAIVPPLTQVSSRIQEILLEQQVNELFDNWLDNLRSEGNVEILDPVLETANAPAGRGEAGK